MPAPESQQEKIVSGLARALEGGAASPAEGARARAKPAPDVSVIVYVDENLEDAARMYAYLANLFQEQRKAFEFIFVDDGNSRRIFFEIEGFQKFVRNARILRLPRARGVAPAMAAGFRHARGRLILTLGSFLQVEPEEIRKMFRKLEEGHDFVNGRRVDRRDSRLNRMHTDLYNWLVRKISGVRLHDFNCTLKLFRREVVKDLPLYGDIYRFLPVLAARQGFSVCEAPVRQRREINAVGVYSAGVYVRRLLDLLALLFIDRFAATPLRFFGTAGGSCFLAGFGLSLYLTAVKFLGGQALADRPLLLLGVLLMVMGVQIVSVGLIGELLVFTSAKGRNDRAGEKVYQ
jgi:hypothetical protein